MNTTCDQCGEVLFGAVNRCWRCGKGIDPLARVRIPPIRRGPIALQPGQALSRRLVHSNPDLPTNVDKPSQSSTVSTGTSAMGPSAMGLSALRNQRGMLGVVFFSPQQRARIALLALFLALVGCYFGFSGPWGLLMGPLAAGFGLVGAHSIRRKAAHLALIFAALSIFLGLGQVVIDQKAKWESRQRLNGAAGASGLGDDVWSDDSLEGNP